MNPSRSLMAHLRFRSARWPEPLTAPANQLTFRDLPRLGLPLIQAVRFASVPASIGGLTGGRPAILPLCIPATNALIGHLCVGSLGLRPLAPLPSTSAPNQRTFADQPGNDRPFLPSSPSKPRLRAKRIGGLTSFELSIGALGNEFQAPLKTLPDRADILTFAVVFPVPDDRQDSTSPGGMCPRAAIAHLPWFLRMSGMLRK